MSNAFYSLVTVLLCFTAVVFLIDQQIVKPRPYKVAWAIGLFVYGVGALAQFAGASGHWTPLEYRFWYLNGAILSAPFLGLGTIYLLMPRKWADRIMAVLAVFTVYAVARVLSVPLTPRTPYATWLHGLSVTQWLATTPSDAVVNAGQHPLMPNDIVLVIIFFNSLGAFALVGGAAWSAWTFLKNRQGLLNSNRLISMVLLMIGGLAPTSAGTLTKFGVSGAFFLLTFIGALFLLAGYLVSIDVFAVFRVPFTEHVLLDRRGALALAAMPGNIMPVAAQKMTSAKMPSSAARLSTGVTPKAATNISSTARVTVKPSTSANATRTSGTTSAMPRANVTRPIAAKSSRTKTGSAKKR